LNTPYLPKPRTYRNTFFFNEVKGLPIHTLFCPKKIEESLAGSLCSTFRYYYELLFKDQNHGFDYLINNDYIFEELPPYIKSLVNNTDIDNDKPNALGLPSYIIITSED
jgi:hypothetical protein